MDTALAVPAVSCGMVVVSNVGLFVIGMAGKLLKETRALTPGTFPKWITISDILKKVAQVPCRLSNEQRHDNLCQRDRSFVDHHVNARHL